MSPVASGGLPHTRATPANGGGPIGATNGTLASGMDSLRGTSRIFPHLDDLVGVRPNVDIHSPFRTILQMGESLAKQAESHLDFRRPDIALQEYVKATIIAVDILPRHKDYSALQGDRPELYRLYIGLTKRINGQHQKFTEVKEMIKENNARSGVKPVIDGISVDTPTIQLRDGTEEKQIQNQSHQAELIGGVSRHGILTSKKSPPPVQPKPDSLHGKAIAHSIGVANGTHKADLAARFAKLRSPEPSVPSQDPRIRTQPIVIPDIPTTNTPPSAPLRSNSTISRPTGPREMPSVPTTDLQQPKISVNVNISAMPRPPDAIYSPDRGVESAATDLKSSASFSNARKYSAPPISTVGPSPLLLDTRREYFSPNPTNDASSHQSLRPKQPSLPDSTTISAEDLMGYIGQGSQSLRVLLVDLRSRDDFDSGHIMAQSIICVEPITLRHGISGEQLGETMVIASDAEQELYDQRQEFDLVVVYDQNSSTLTSTSSTTAGSNKIQDFISAVYDYGYEKRLKRPPVLLLGGLNAWIDLLGPSALKPTTIRSSISKTSEKQNQSLSRAVAIRNSYLADKSKRRTFRQLTTQEQNYWDATLSSEAKPTDSEDDISEEFSYAKTTEDFFRRYPELPSPQQSMISPAQRLALEHQKLDDELKSTTPKPPARPAPALPRQRSSGISDRRLMVSHAHSAPINSITERKPPALTGLENTGNSCYVNSIIQAFGATVFLRDILRGYTYPPPLRIPTKKGESGSDCPQLMVRCFGNLFGHLWAGRYDYVRPTTLLVCAS
jgi:ubiquitin carboxyl-terminal hydrolase 8